MVGNKWGIQLGAKYIDAFGVPNLDLQLESNIVGHSPIHIMVRLQTTHITTSQLHPLGEFFGVNRNSNVPACSKMVYQWEDHLL